VTVLLKLAKGKKIQTDLAPFEPLPRIVIYFSQRSVKVLGGSQSSHNIIAGFGCGVREALFDKKKTSEPERRKLTSYYRDFSCFTTGMSTLMLT